MNKYIIYIITVCAALSSCKDDNGVKVASMTASPASATIGIREQIGILATAYPKEAAQQFAWTSSNPAVAKVEETLVAGMSVGQVTGLTEGEAVITAVSSEDASIRTSVTITVVYVRTTGIQLSAGIMLSPGETRAVKASILPDGASDNVLTWSTADPSIATVNANGALTGVSFGETVLTATLASDPSITASMAVDVTYQTPAFGGQHVLSKTGVCTIKASDFDIGGEGVSFHDTGTNNESGAGDAYRKSGGDNSGGAVDIHTDGTAIGWIAAGEWLNYTVIVKDGGNYTMDLETGVNGASRIHIEVDNVNLTGPVPLAASGGYAGWVWKPCGNLRLTEGAHTIRLHFEAADLDIRYLRFSYARSAEEVISGVKADVKGLWLFNNPSSNTGTALKGQPLTVGNNDGHSEVITVDNDGVVTVPQWAYLRCDHRIPAGSSGKIDEYTLMLDIKYGSGSWFGLYQTNLSNNDDSDLWIDNGSKKLGVGDIGYGGSIASGVWNRVVISVKKGSFYNVYVNGVMQHSANTSNERFFLDPAGLLLFADNSGEDEPISASAAAIWGKALDNEDVAAMQTYKSWWE